MAANRSVFPSVSHKSCTISAGLISNTKRSSLFPSHFTPLGPPLLLQPTSWAPVPHQWKFPDLSLQQGSLSDGVLWGVSLQRPCTDGHTHTHAPYIHDLPALSQLSPVPTRWLSSRLRRMEEKFVWRCVYLSISDPLCNSLASTPSHCVLTCYIVAAQPVMITQTKAEMKRWWVKGQENGGAPEH